MKKLIREIHRRSLWQVLVIYGVGAYIGFEVIQTLTEGLGLPSWFPAFAIMLFIVGLPIVLATAFVQEGLGSAARRDPTLLPDVEIGGAAAAERDRREAAGARRVFTWRNALMGGVFAFALWGVVAAGWLLLAGDIVREAREPGVAAAADERGKSIAVLPFENLSDDPENAFFAAGIHDDILSQLSKIRDLTVISRTSVMQYAGTEKDMRTIANELGARTILEGSVRRAGGQVRIVTQLIDAQADAHLWSETYDRELTVANVFAIQSEIAERIAQALKAELSPQEKARIASTPTENTEAYDFYLRGKEYFQRGQNTGGENYRIAQQMYERAVELDPQFALAHASLSRVHSLFYWFSFDRSAKRLSQAREAAGRALELDPDLSEGHLALGYYYYYGHRDYDRALEEFAVAERGLPGNDELLAAKGYIYRRQGRWEEALSNLERAAALNPRDPNYLRELGATHAALRRYAQAEGDYDRALALAPDDVLVAIFKAWLPLNRDGDTGPLRTLLAELPPGADLLRFAPFWRYWVEYYDRNYAAALDALSGTDREYFEFGDFFVPKPQLAGEVHFLSGDSAAARAAFDSAIVILEARIRDRPDDAGPHISLGRAYAGLGRKEEAIREGLRAVELLPISRDALGGPDFVLELAWIYAMVGEQEAAIERLDRYLSVPAEWSIEGLLHDPLIDLLRDHPRFQALLEQHRRKDAGG